MNKANKQQVPKYRFQKFLDNWEKMPLSFFSRKATVKNRDESIKETFTNSAEFGIVSQRDFFDKDISNTTNIGGYYIVEENDFVYNPRISNYAPFGPINRNKLGRKGIMSPLYHVFRTKDVNHDFLSSYFETTRWHKFMYITGDKGARADRFAIGYTEFEKMPIYMPKLEEQIQIGNFFQQLDKLIELQTRAVESAETYKKAMLQKMFPQKGEKVPRVRFEGFSGDWKLSVLNKLAARFDNLRIPVTASDRIEGETPYYGANGIQGYVEGFTHEGEFVLLAEDGANDLTNYPVQHVFGKIWVNNHAHVLGAKKNIMSNSYLANVLKTINMIPYLVGSGRAKLNSSAMMEIKIKYPILEEQTLIGNLFQKLDQNIKFEKKKLEQYQTMKRALLQRMFV